MTDRLHGTQMLLGQNATEKLRASHVMVVGCGAVGSVAIEALARIGVGHLTLIDCDKIEESNINRQLFALDSSIGMAKVDVAASRIYDINPDTTVIPLQMFFDDQTELDIVPDFVIDAIDTVESKIALYKWCNAHGVPFISSMGAARKTDMTQIKISKISQTSACPLAARIRKIVRTQHMPEFDVVYSTQVPDKNVLPGRVFGSIMTVTGMFGLLMADYCIKYLIKDIR